jgi:hypothetical protein
MFWSNFSLVCKLFQQKKNLYKKKWNKKKFFFNGQSKKVSWGARITRLYTIFFLSCLAKLYLYVRSFLLVSAERTGNKIFLLQKKMFFLSNLHTTKKILKIYLRIFVLVCRSCSYSILSLLHFFCCSSFNILSYTVCVSLLLLLFAIKLIITYIIIISYYSSLLFHFFFLVFFCS